MEDRERDLIERVLRTNVQLRRLYNEHMNLERKLSRFESRPFLTQPEEQELKQLKFRKLRGVDKMMVILSENEAATNSNAVTT